VGGWRQIFQLLAGEQIDGSQVDLGVTVLAGLGGGHVDDLAGTLLDDNEAVLAQSRALEGKGEGRAGVGGLEGELVLRSLLSGSAVPSLEGVVGTDVRVGWWWGRRFV